MPQSSPRPGTPGASSSGASAQSQQSPLSDGRTDRPAATTIPSNPGWFVPVMCGLMILGVLWVSTFYITSGDWPVRSLGYWNLGIGMGLIMAGFVMATRWR